MTPTGAYISIDGIVNRIRLNKSKPIHAYWKYLLLATEAIRELTFTSGLLVHHKILTRKEGESWFNLPDGFADLYSISAYSCDGWRPLSVKRGNITTGLNENELYPTDIELGDDWSPFTGMIGKQAKTLFSPTVFSPTFFETEVATLEGRGNHEHWGRHYSSPVIVDVPHGMILAGDNFIEKLYITYSGTGSVDTMTQIPVIAQAAIEAYVDWKYAANKRNGLNEGRALKQNFDEQHRLYRARKSNLNIKAIKQLFTRNLFQFRSYDDTLRPNDPFDNATLATAVFFGTKDTATLLTTQQIEAGTKQAYTPLGDISATYNNTEPKYLWVTYPAQEILTNYFINQFDFGVLGSGGTFGLPIRIDNYFFIQSIYPTQLDTVQFKH